MRAGVMEGASFLLLSSVCSVRLIMERECVWEVGENGKEASREIESVESELENGCSENGKGEFPMGRFEREWG
ncbi:crossover junction endonuclease MUS81 [Corchorus olitorius]|uniref:Crossover junction endonuclease MUS81 n=1 Tax=Corchorus olitorius TaxID=93759 RepID=A0A1R3FVU6_9ROSI|nr:crossover junction endonuclease MUS81 [Corchorus olitorius]